MSDLLSITLKRNIQYCTTAVSTLNVNASIAQLENTSATDTVNLNGVDRNLLGVISDERLASLSNVTVTISSNCKTLSRDEIKRIKSLIFNNLHKTPEQEKTPSYEDITETPEQEKTPVDGDSTQADGDSTPVDGDSTQVDGDSTQVEILPDYTLTRKATSSDTTTEGVTDEGTDKTTTEGVTDEGTDKTTTEGVTDESTSKTNKLNVKVPASGSIVVKLTESVDGKDLYYTISSRNESEIEVQFEYWDNGRFVIVGDYLNIVAKEGQEDDIILIGSNCILDTNSSNDIIRVGYFIDSDDNTSTDPTVYKGIIEHSSNNNISAGDGDDYIINYGFWNCIYAGENNEDNDKLTVVGFSDITSSYSWAYDFEQEYGYTSNNNSAVGESNGSLDGGFQGSYGDCKLLSFLNSLNKKLDEYVEITKSGSNYVVKFKESGFSTTITSTDLNATEWADGDIDLVLVEIAFEKLIKSMGYNMDNDTTSVPDHDDKMLGLSANNFLISKIFFNQDAAACVNIKQESIENFFGDLLQQYLDGKISTLVLGTHDAGNTEGLPDNNKLGIYYNHAYAVKGGVAGEYIELSNPWDSNDIIRLDWDDLYKYFNSINLFGDTYDYVDDVYGFSSTSSTTIESSEYTIEQVESTLTGQEQKYVEQLKYIC